MYQWAMILLILISCSPPENEIRIRGQMSLVDGKIEKGIMSHKASWLMSSPVNFVEIDPSGKFELILKSEDHVSINFGHQGYEPQSLEFDPQFGQTYEFNVTLNRYQKSPTSEYYVVTDATLYRIVDDQQKLIPKSGYYELILDNLPDTMKTLKYQITFPGYRTFEGTQRVEGYDRSIDFYSNVEVNNGSAIIRFDESKLSKDGRRGWFNDVKNMEYELSVIDFFNLRRNYITTINQKIQDNETNEVGLESLFKDVKNLINSKNESKTKLYLSFLAKRNYGKFTSQFDEDSRKAEQYAKSNIQEALYENFSIVRSIASLDAQSESTQEAKDEYIVQFYLDLLNRKISPFMKLNIYQELADHYQYVQKDSMKYVEYCDKILSEYPDTFNSMRIRNARKAQN